tara:strand:- start:82 stop:480 length:399 start_codon:yes stop_codon:yes gene_type:complete
MTRYFTLEEAQGLVNWIEGIFNDLNLLLKRLDELNDNIEQMENPVVSNGIDDVVTERIESMERELSDTLSRINEEIQSIHKRGILVKSIQHGLVDFPYIFEDREVYLCWHSGEQEIKSWHEIDTGFADRQPL